MHILDHIIVNHQVLCLEWMCYQACMHVCNVMLRLVLQDLWGDVEISWNHVEFEVRYESLAEEIKIGECV